MCIHIKCTPALSFPVAIVDIKASWRPFDGPLSLSVKSKPANGTCLIQPTSVWCILSHQYQPQSFANCAILCAVRLHQNCPYATTKLGASQRVCQPSQPVTVGPINNITITHQETESKSKRLLCGWKHGSSLDTRSWNWWLPCHSFNLVFWTNSWTSSTAKSVNAIL